ncbi:GNAT family N-acetyltransferase [Elioraea rosea]|uniref:GNAT family N-acetyltransferase n=1 Tax=Elioraea rosea TaxID=2492390 RepID=UPI001315AA89|nr:GNAT family N-acetyltransferase [Elioraea rosea]
MPEIRTAAAEDEKALHALLRASFTPYVGALGREVTPTAHARLSEALARGGVRVAVDGAAILGFAALLPRGDALEVDLLGVAPKAQRRGLGRMLLADAEAQARAGGFIRLELHTAAMFAHLLRLYTAAGYRETHRGLPPHGADAYERVFFEKHL